MHSLSSLPRAPSRSAPSTSRQLYPASTLYTPGNRDTHMGAASEILQRDEAHLRPKSAVAGVSGCAIKSTTTRPLSRSSSSASMRSFSRQRSHEDHNSNSNSNSRPPSSASHSRLQSTKHNNTNRTSTRNPSSPPFHVATAPHTASLYYKVPTRSRNLAGVLRAKTAKQSTPPKRRERARTPPPPQPSESLLNDSVSQSSLDAGAAIPDVELVGHGREYVDQPLEIHRPHSRPSSTEPIFDKTDQQIRRSLGDERAGSCIPRYVRHAELLQKAVISGEIDAVRRLLERGYNVNFFDEEGNTPLHAAIARTHVVIAVLLLKFGAMAEVADFQGRTPLHLAALHGIDQLVNILLSSGASLSPVDCFGVTPLHCAADSGHSLVVNTLLEKGADIDVETREGNTPLLLACRAGHEMVAKQLTEYGASLNAHTMTGLSALHLSAAHGSHNLVDHLLLRGADVHAVTNQFITPLHVACKQGGRRNVRALLQYGANVNAQSMRHITPLHAALLNGHEKLAVMLVQEYGARVDVADIDGETQIELATKLQCFDFLTGISANPVAQPSPSQPLDFPQ